jgi:hypothetical protein
MHPNLLADEKHMNVTEPIYGSTIQLRYNTIFEILMQLRIYLVFLSIIRAA